MVVPTPFNITAVSMVYSGLIVVSVFSLVATATHFGSVIKRTPSIIIA